MDLTDTRQIRALLERHGFRFSKSLGQNFLCAGWVPRRIAESAGLDETAGVLEIGPGLGCLTRELSQRAGRVVSVELDRSLAPILSETLSGCENVTVVFADILKTDIATLAREEFTGFPRLAVCANLPYGITSPVLTALTGSGLFPQITVMVQRELARRVCAKENTPEYGAFSLLMQWRCLPEILFEVPPGCFVPAPKVTSAVLRLCSRSAPPFAVKDEKLMFSLIRAAFNQRRKTLVNALANGLGGRFDREEIAAALARCGLDARIRGEALSLERFARLSDVLAGC